MIIFEVIGWKRMYQNEDTRENIIKHFDTEEEVQQFEDECEDWVDRYGSGSRIECKVYRVHIPDDNYPVVREFKHGCW